MIHRSTSGKRARWRRFAGSGDTALAAAVISGRPASEKFADYIRPLAKEPTIKGLRQVLHGPGTPAGFCLQPEFVRGIRLLGELGLSFDLCMRPGELRDGAKLAEACPETRFILDHCGNAGLRRRPRRHGRRTSPRWPKRPNVCGKVSGIVASTKGHAWRPDDLAPIINHVLEVFGPDRVVFGGDWPVCLLGSPLAGWVECPPRGRSRPERAPISGSSSTTTPSGFID